MKLKQLLVTAIFGIGLVNLNSLANTFMPMAAVNKTDKNIFFAYCAKSSLPGKTMCSGFKLKPGESYPFYTDRGGELGKLNVYWFSLDSQQQALETTDASLTKFTVNPDGSITGSK